MQVHVPTLTVHAWLSCLIWTWKSKKLINAEMGLPALHDIQVSLAVAVTSGTPGGCILTAHTDTREKLLLMFVKGVISVSQTTKV